jgi:hypothetical protein
MIYTRLKPANQILPDCELIRLNYESDLLLTIHRARKIIHTYGLCAVCLDTAKNLTVSCSRFLNRVLKNVKTVLNPAGQEVK